MGKILNTFGWTESIGLVTWMELEFKISILSEIPDPKAMVLFVPYWNGDKVAGMGFSSNFWCFKSATVV